MIRLERLMSKLGCRNNKMDEDRMTSPKLEEGPAVNAEEIKNEIY